MKDIIVWEQVFVSFVDVCVCVFVWMILGVIKHSINSLFVRKHLQGCNTRP